MSATDPNGSGFFGLDVAGVAAQARLECGVCWNVYEPAAGDPTRGIPPGTAFRALPANWLCPHCDAPREKFMVLDEPAGAR